jgi:hypothetical protein
MELTRFVALDENRSIGLVGAARFALNSAYRGRIRVREAPDNDRIQRVPSDQIQFMRVSEILRA